MIPHDELYATYVDHLDRQILPFWLDHCIDEEYGGLLNVVSDNGTVLSTDKYLWSQGRALWTFSALYRRFRRDKHFLEIADALFRFLVDHGRDSQGRWHYALHRDGTVAEPHKSIYVDAFVLYGVIEYARATGSKEAERIARQIYTRTNRLVDDHSLIRTEPLTIPDGAQSHGVFMIFSLVYHELGLYLDDDAIKSRALELADRILTMHLDGKTGVLFEYVPALPRGEGSTSTALSAKTARMLPSDVAQTYVPGHVIECMWFLNRIFVHHGDADKARLTVQVTKTHIEAGWDDEYGGIMLARRAGGGTPAWFSPEAKVYWVHAEALCALLRYHVLYGESAGNEWIGEWFDRIYRYTFALFPDTKNGEWHHYFDRAGKPTPVAVQGLPVKDPFHIPRWLIISLELLKEKTGESE